MSHPSPMIEAQLRKLHELTNDPQVLATALLLGAHCRADGVRSVARFLTEAVPALAAKLHEVADEADSAAALGALKPTDGDGPASSAAGTYCVPQRHCPRCGPGRIFSFGLVGHHPPSGPADPVECFGCFRSYRYDELVPLLVGR